MAAPARERVAGVNARVPVLGGETRPYVNFDNAASTPPFQRVLDAVTEFAPWYGNVHRGTGFKSRLSTWAYDEARASVARWVGADAEHDVVLFMRNATEGLNRVARRFPFAPDAVVLTTLMEHHSNDLPWRRMARVVHVGVGQDGRLDEHELRSRLREHAGRVALLAVTGASNVTGIVNPVHTYARWAHEAGGRIVVDAAQLAPHRAIEMRPGNDPEHLDFLAFSAHKMYAPFGIGVLVGPRDVFAAGDPDDVGGGTVDSVDLDRVRWTALPEREEAGTPCITGAVALGAAVREYETIGWACINAHEARLTHHALEVLRAIPGITLYGDVNPAHAADRLGVVAFNLESLPHGLVAAVLAQEWGIATRDGCFCAHPYVKALLGVNDAASHQIEERIARGDRSDLPGAVRVSLGLYNTMQEIDVLGEALRAIAAGRFEHDYVLDPRRGEYLPAGYAERFTEYCSL